MNASKKLQLIDKIMGYAPVLLSLLVPVFFLPITVEFFEFNKLALVSVATILLLVLWSVKIVFTKKILVAKSKLDLALGVLVLVTVLGTVFSLHQTTSLFGSTGRWFPSLFGLLVMVVFYYIVASNAPKNSAEKFAPILLIGATISTVVSLLAYYKLYLGTAAFLKIQNFSIAGSTTTTAILAAFAVVLAVAAMYNTQNVLMRLGLIATAVINLYFIMIVQDWTILLVLAVGFAATFVFKAVDVEMIKSNHLHSSILGAGFILVLLVTLVPALSRVTVDPNFPRPVVLGVADSWRIASSAIRELPILGSGPSTFYLDFPRYRTLSMNNELTWNFRFDKPFNEVFNVMATLGIVGLIALVLFGSRVVKLSFDLKDTNTESPALAYLGTGLLMGLAVYVVTYATVVNTFLLFVMMALAVAYKANNAESVAAEDYSVASLTNFAQTDKSGIVKREYLHFVAITPVLAIAGVGAFFMFRLYSGEFWMRKSIEAAMQSNGNLTYAYQNNAINANPRMDTYQNAYAQTNLALANALASREGLTEQDKQTIQQLVAQAIRSSRAATEVLNPLNVTGWETRASIYTAISGIAQDADKWAVSAYQNAIQLDPTNPILRLQLGGLYYAQKDYLAAANQFRSSATLKPDYANAHYNFAQSLRELKDYQNTIRALEATKRLVPEGSDDFNKVTDEITQLKAMPEVANAAGTKPTVEDLTTNPGTNPATSQGGLKKPTELNQVNTQVQVPVQPQVQPAPQPQPAPVNQ